MNNFIQLAYSRKNSQKLVQKRKLAFSDTDSIVKSLKPNFDSFKEGSSDRMLLVYVKISMEIEVKVVQNGH